jgi:H+/Cl- antiporter ClcA
MIQRTNKMFQALWAIPNIQEKSTKVPFIVTAILTGAITYAIVFNMDFMTTKLTTWYLPRRQHVVKLMHDKSEWESTGKRFDEFKPSSLSKVPTEWWIPLFVFRELFTKRTWIWKPEPEVNTSGNTQAKGSTPTPTKGTASEKMSTSQQATTPEEASAPKEQAVPEGAPKDFQTNTSMIFSRFKLGGRKHVSAV